MPVDSVKKTSSLQVHQGNDAQEQRERLRQGKKDKQDKEKNTRPEQGKEDLDPHGSLSIEVRQILDSQRTVELLQPKPLEPKTLRRHAFIELTQKDFVKKSTSKNLNKLNKSA